MPAAPVWRTLLCSALPVIVLAACGGPSEVARVPMQPAYHTSRDGDLHYRLPVGWFDATSDSQATRHAIWVLRNDYGASITVEGINLDASAGQELGEKKLLQLAQLTMPLLANDRSAAVQEAPALFSVRGREYCAFELVTFPSDDTLRVVLFDTGRRTYTATFYTKAVVGGTNSEELRAVQEGFLGSLRW
jgi:hypothetical protein